MAFLIGCGLLAGKEFSLPTELAGRWRGLHRWCVVLLCAANMVTGLHAQAPPLTEYQVKAAFLYNFAKFVEWPADAFAGPNAPLRICVLGQDPFGGDLEQITAGKSVNGRTIQVDHVPEVSQARTCHIVFVSSAKNDEIKRALEGLRGASVLTVGDTKDFVAQGGIINLVLEDNRIRFEVNLKAAERARLKISAKLLSLARLVQV